jgi:syntaxin 18
VKIAQLQEIFTKKVLEQDKEIDNINLIAVGTTENVVEGNEQLREAMKKNAGLRVWILFFLLMMSFAVLFLDWYND